MEALAAAINPPQRPTSPTEDWEQRCKNRNYLAQPLGTQALLYRATGGNATAMAIATRVLELTHAGIRVRGRRPEWTRPVATKDLAEELDVDVRSIQLALNVLCSENGEPAILARRKAPGGAYSYQAQPWLWEDLAEASGSGKVSPAAPTQDNTSELTHSPTFVTTEPVIVFAGKKPRSLKLSDAVREALPTIRYLRFDAGGADLSFTSRIDAGELLISASLLNTANSGRNQMKLTSPALLNRNDLAASDAHLRLISAKRANTATGPSSAKLASLSVENATLKREIDERLRPILGEGIDPPKLAETAAALGSDPNALQHFLTGLERKIRRGKITSYGLCPHLASAASIAAAAEGHRTQRREPTETETAEVDQRIAQMEEEERDRDRAEVRAQRLIQELYPGNALAQKLSAIKRELQAQHPDLYARKPEWHPALENHAMRQLKEEVLADAHRG